MDSVGKKSTSSQWCSKQEWRVLSSLICSLPGSGDISQLKLAVSMLSCLSSRLPQPPIGVLMTSELLQAHLAVATETNCDTQPHHRSTSAFAIIRFVNYVCHALEGQERQPVHRAAARLNLATWLVTLRHDASHGPLPPAGLLRAALDAALLWVIAEYWREAASEDGTTPPISVTTCLQQLEATLAGPRGRHLNRSVLTTCLSSEGLRRGALRLVADSMVTTELRTKAAGEHPSTMVLSWVSALSVVGRAGQLTNLLETLLATSGSEVRRLAAAVWAERVVRAVSHAAGEQIDATDVPDDTGRLDSTWRALLAAASPPPIVHWRRLLRAALLHRSGHTGRLLPPLLAGVDPPLPEKRRRLLYQLLEVASGEIRLSPSTTPPQPVTFSQLRPLGVRPPQAADAGSVAPSIPATVAPPSIPATVAPPPVHRATTWSRCTDDSVWRTATAVGRLPWQQNTPVLQSKMDDTFSGYTSAV